MPTSDTAVDLHGPQNTIDRIPGLSGLVEKISSSIAVFIITTLEPFVKPLIGTATTALGQSSQAVVDSQDQYEVWNNWTASDPTHSFLAKVTQTSLSLLFH